VEGERDCYTPVATMLAASIAGPVIGMAQGALDNVLETLTKERRSPVGLHRRRLLTEFR
jgi:hypothetical protein